MTFLRKRGWLPQFSLQSLFFVVTSVLCGGNAAHRLAAMETPTIGGVKVGFSTAGHAIVFATGALAGAVSSVMAVTFVKRLGVPRFKSGVCLILVAVALGTATGAVMTTAMFFLLLTVPAELTRIFIGRAL